MQQRTCPLIGCETAFETSEDMLQHVYCCPHISSGRYRCYKCKGVEVIGTYHVMDDCQQKCTTDKRAAVVNSWNNRGGFKPRNHSFMSILGCSCPDTTPSEEDSLDSRFWVANWLRGIIDAKKAPLGTEDHEDYAYNASLHDYEYSAPHMPELDDTQMHEMMGMYLLLHSGAKLTPCRYFYAC